MKQHTLHVQGVHCKACKVLIEDILREEEGVARVEVDIFQQTVMVEGEIEDNAEILTVRWTKLLEPHKYSLSLHKPEKKNDMQALAYAIPLGFVLLAIFFALQRSGLMNFGFEGGLSSWTAVLIGVVASLSSCLALVGGLVLSISAKMSQGVSSSRPFLFFHSGRILGFVLLGGILGAVGSALAVNSKVTAMLGIFAALVMISLGINLLGIFRFTRRFQLALPRSMFDRVTRIENGFWAPFLIGAGTFFLPCGFTQSMQVAALSSGSFWSGAMIMTMFALGTLPMLAFLSFGSFRFAHSRFAPVFFKTAGVVVIGLGFFSLLAGLAGLAIIKPLFTI